ncbi:hypothetical protein Tco_0941102 [Tanacetum coccineum]|uniref:Integrase zinc-binding domain-containing protein n=1 Tax=Tanacetum coccineum TaxID=301880 RepID=A0ABQ5DS84_9ASTR
MANENVTAPAPTRSDNQILPFNAWVPIRKSNYVLNLQKKQRNPIFQIFVDILQSTNFFRAFTASAYVPAIYIQQEALEITPIDQAHQIESPPSGDAIMDFVNELGYPGEIHFVSRMVVNNLYQPWKAILSMINQCLTCKTFGSGSLFHLVKEDHKLGNLKFIPKGKVDEVFGMRFPRELITDNIRNVPYYNAYLEMVSKHDHKITAKGRGKKKSTSKANQSKKPATTKKSKPMSSKQSKLAPTMKPKVAQEKPSEPSPTKHPKRGKMSLESFQAYGQAFVGRVAFCEPAASELQTPKKKSTINQYIFQRHIPATQVVTTGPSTQPEDDTSTNMVRESPSPADAETGANVELSVSEADTKILSVGEELQQGEEVSKTVTLEERTIELDEGQDGSDPS